VVPGGNDNRTFRLGEDFAARLPSAAGYAAAVEKEQRWLPVIARAVSLPVPEPVGAGRPGAGYPFSWSVNRWLPGESAETGPVDDLSTFAADIADFVADLQQVETRGAPAAGAHSFFRGASLMHYDEELRRAVGALEGRIPTARALDIWDEGLAAEWTGSPVWFHGDLSSGNLLVQDGRLSAAIDFGTSGVGDPACDMYIAWTFLDARGRRLFRDRLDVDDGMWARGRAWVLWKALITFAGAGPSAAWARAVAEDILAGDDRSG
jgi:aminoglycoside phosphotransferase (APT) family kinase protein